MSTALEFQDYKDGPDDGIPSWAREESADEAGGDSVALLPDADTAGSGATAASTTDGGASAPGPWSMAYYRQMFDIDTAQVLHRIRKSVWPVKNQFLRDIKSRGDLYGPFWICATLVFTMAMCGNLAHYKKAADPADWHYDFSKLSLAATVVYSYATIVPTLLWALMKWKSTTSPSLLELFCLYGYSLFLFIPISIVCVFPAVGDDIQWGLVMTAAVVTGAVLFANLMSCLGNLPHTYHGSAIVLSLAAHLGLAVGFKLYFFKY